MLSISTTTQTTTPLKPTLWHTAHPEKECCLGGNLCPQQYIEANYLYKPLQTLQTFKLHPVTVPCHVLHLKSRLAQTSLIRSHTLLTIDTAFPSHLRISMVHPMHGL